jgi:hypothetical protein
VRSVFDPADLFAQAFEPYERLAVHNHIRYCAFVDPGLARLRGDSEPLRRVLAYLLESAFEHTPPLGTVQASIERIAESDEQATVRFRIEHTGGELNVAERAFVFEPYRYERTMPNVASRVRSLALANALMLQLGAMLEIDHTHVGVAYLFTLTFRKAENRREYTPPSFKQYRVAYYHPEDHDDPTDRWLLRYWRILAGEVVIVRDLNPEQLRGFDLLVVDHALPIVRERIQAIKQLNIRLVVVGNASYRHEIESHIDAKSSAVLRPVNYDKLIQAVARLE